MGVSVSGVSTGAGAGSARGCGPWGSAGAVHGFIPLSPRRTIGSFELLVLFAALPLLRFNMVRSPLCVLAASFRPAMPAGYLPQKSQRPLSRPQEWSIRVVLIFV